MFTVTEVDQRRCEDLLRLLDETQLSGQGSEIIGIAQLLVWLRDLKGRLSASVAQNREMEIRHQVESETCKKEAPPSKVSTKTSRKK